MRGFLHPQAGSPSGHSRLWPRCCCSWGADLHLRRLWLPTPLFSHHVWLWSSPGVLPQGPHERGAWTCRPCHVGPGEQIGGSWRAAAPLSRLWRPTPLRGLWPSEWLLVLLSSLASPSSVPWSYRTWWTPVCGRRVFSRHSQRFQMGSLLWFQKGMLGKPGCYAISLHWSGSLFPAITWPACKTTQSSVNPFPISFSSFDDMSESAGWW